jgi:sec-independent protein translocase protein TatA
VSIGPFQILIIALVLLVLFGRGRISEAMGDVGKGVKSFRKGFGDEEEAAHSPAAAGADLPVEAAPAPDQTLS